MQLDLWWWPPELLFFNIIITFILITYMYSIIAEGKTENETPIVLTSMALVVLVIFNRFIHGDAQVCKEKVRVYFVDNIPVIVEDGKIIPLVLKQLPYDDKITRVTETVDWKYRKVSKVTYIEADVAR
jgi:uncharacterized membrane protein YcaP (DUF421 family)